jgi:dihydroflavonol-4-reductase
MVLVTGGTGFLGSYLLLQLATEQVNSGQKIRAICRNFENIRKTKSVFDVYKKTDFFDRIEWVEADILDIPSLENAFLGIDFVYHCAGFISFDPKDENKLRKINIEGTANIVDFCVSNGVKKLCFISSIAALGDLVGYEYIISETNEWNPEKPHSDYAISKYGAEMEVWRGQQEGLDVIILNPGVILGKVTKELQKDNEIYKLFAKVKNGLSFYTNGSTGFIAVTDVANMAVLLMKSDIVNERFLLITENLTFQEILNAIADGYKVKRPHILVKPFFLRTYARIDWLLSIVFRTKRQMTLDTAKSAWACDLYANDKIKMAIESEFLDIHQCIKEILEL